MSNPNPEKEWFGDKKVSADEKTELVRGVFDSVADKYDIMNDLMSGGVHRLWKDRFIKQIRPRPGLHYLDVAGGTGDIAFRIRKAVGDDAKITICDLDEAMLRVGRDRAIDKGWPNEFDWVTGNAENLPMPDSSVDIYTIAFGMRNVTRIDTALAEAFRVLKPGGKFFCMEFSRVEDPLVAKLYDGYSRKIIPAMGKMVAKDEDSYQYLVESIRKFPSQKEFAKRIKDAGFEVVKYSNLTFGITSIHSGWKL
jgi:demethylmenaquinone methyltransferase/2-methoxy-6-polyprenyl-1,4-benzoquinol methylase